MSTNSPATSLVWHRVVDPVPRLLVLPPDVASLDEAEAAIELWEFYKRRTLDPWQRLSVQLKMATRADGRWAARTTGEEVPRQAGKGDAQEVVELWGIAQRGERILHTIHDAVLLATESHARMLSLIDGHADLRRKKARAWSGTGQQMIEMRNGGIIWYRTRSGGGGRGLDEVDRLVVDEAQHAEPAQIEATSPTQLASVNPQTNVMGTGALEGKSAWWWRMRKRALSDSPGEFAYLGFTAEELSVDSEGRVHSSVPDLSTVDLFLAVVQQVHPALQRRPDLLDFFAEEYRKLGAAGAAREYLLVWDPEPSVSELGPVDMAAWEALSQTSSIADSRMWSLAVSRDRDWAALGVAGRREDGRLHVEWMEHRSGTGWIVDRVVEGWRARRIPIRIHRDAPEGSFVDPLRQAGVEVVEVATTDVAKATGQFLDAVKNRTLVHIGQPTLTRQLRGAQVDTSKSGAAIWVDGGKDITTLKAVTVALGGVAAENEPAEAFAIVL